VPYIVHQLFALAGYEMEYRHRSLREKEANMAKYLITASYTSEGAKGLLVEGGSGRKKQLEKTLQSMGGKLETMYFAYGDNDVMLIVDVPDAVSGLALSIAANSSGTVRVTTTPLITVEEVDAACKKSVAYRPAGAAGV
jgi:uncharacterized protein with GYD domain